MSQSNKNDSNDAFEKQSPQITEGTPDIEDLRADEVEPQEYAKVLRKIDFRLMPVMCLVYSIQFLDKTCLSYSSIMGLRTETNLTSSQYSWISSMFCQ